MDYDNKANFILYLSHGVSMGAKKVILIVITLFLLFGSFSVTFGESREATNMTESTIVLNDAYTPHDTIKIDNDTQLEEQATNEGWPGDGSTGNPYIIQGYDIDAKGAGNAIYIGNTTLYFVIKNCIFYNASKVSWPYQEGAGIALYNLSYAVIENVTVYENYYGIYLISTENITVKNSTITQNEIGLESVWDTVNSTIRGNLIANNDDNGIYLDDGGKNKIIGNRIENNRWIGINIYSKYNILSDNRMFNNSLRVGYFMDEFTTQNISQNNTVNGKPVYYYKNVNMNNASFSGNAGEIILGNVSYFRIENVVLSNGSVGINIGYSKYITISNNTIENQSAYAIFMQYCSDNIIENNKMYGNRNGVFMRYSDNIRIKDNDMGNMFQSSVWLMHSDNNIIENNNIYGENAYEIELEASDDNRISNNTISKADTAIILYRGSQGNTINGNDIENTYGDSIEVQVADNNIIYSNEINGSRIKGIYLYSANNNIIKGNNITNSSDYGIYIGSGSNNLIYGNCFYYNHGSTDSYNSSHVQAYDDGTNNSWNSSTIGNYWRDWRGSDSDNDGIVDEPYIIDGSSGAKDYYPLTKAQPIPELSWIVIIAIIFLAFFVSIRRR